MDATTRFDTQIIGALPVIVNYFERLRLGTIINEMGVRATAGISELLGAEVRAPLDVSRAFG